MVGKNRRGRWKSRETHRFLGERDWAGRVSCLSGLSSSDSDSDSGNLEGRKEGRKEGRRREGGEQVRRSSRLREVEAQETQKKARRPSNSPHVFRAVSRLLKNVKVVSEGAGKGRREGCGRE